MRQAGQSLAFPLRSIAEDCGSLRSGRGSGRSVGELLALVARDRGQRRAVVSERVRQGGRPEKGRRSRGPPISGGQGNSALRGLKRRLPSRKTHGPPGGTFFGGVPKTPWGRKAPTDELKRIEVAFNCYVIRPGEHKIFIETGAGDKPDPRLRQRMALPQPAAQGQNGPFTQNA